MKVGNFNNEKMADSEYLRDRENEALASGVEPFSAKKAAEYYCPDEFSGSEQALMRRLGELAGDYYASGARTIKEWAVEREKYDMEKDD